MGSLEPEVEQKLRTLFDMILNETKPSEEFQNLLKITPLEKVTFKVSNAFKVSSVFVLRGVTLLAYAALVGKDQHARLLLIDG